jgi:Fic family protein
MNRQSLTEIVRQRLHRLDEPHSAHYGVLPPPPPEEGISLGAVAASVGRANGALAEASAIAKLSTDGFVLNRILIRKEAVSSSSIEGTHSTLDELLEIEEGGEEEAPDDVRQVRDYAIALEHLVPEAASQGNDVFSVDLVQELHRTVMASDSEYKDIPGDFRDRVVWIGGTGSISTSTYNPPAPRFIRECLDQQVSYLRCDGMQAMTQDLITRMAIAHAHFEAIHPFRDGNGRVGRLLLPLMMAAEGRSPLYLSPYVEANKGHYYDALKAAQQRLDYAALTGFFADAMVATVHEVKKTRAQLDALHRDWRSRRTFRANSAAAAAIDILHEFPVVTIRRLESLLDVSFQAASNAVRDLVLAGILAERTGHKRNRMFIAKEAVDILNRPFGASRESEDDEPPAGFRI